MSIDLEKNILANIKKYKKEFVANFISACFAFIKYPPQDLTIKTLMLDLIKSEGAPLDSEQLYKLAFSKLIELDIKEHEAQELILSGRLSWPFDKTKLAELGISDDAASELIFAGKLGWPITKKNLNNIDIKGVDANNIIFMSELVEKITKNNQYQLNNDENLKLSKIVRDPYIIINASNITKVIHSYNQILLKRDEIEVDIYNVISDKSKFTMLERIIFIPRYICALLGLCQSPLEYQRQTLTKELQEEYNYLSKSLIIKADLVKIIIEEKKQQLSNSYRKFRDIVKKYNSI